MIWKKYQINKAKVLLAIRDGKATTYKDLNLLFSSFLFPHSFLTLININTTGYKTELDQILNELIIAGLIEKDSDEFKVTNQLKKVQSALDISLTYLSQLGPDLISIKPIFGAPSIDDTFPQIFVLMPFSERFKPIYEDHISNIVKEMNLSIGRADDFFAARSIISDIWNAIFHSMIIIADCTGRNPNVFYEIGIAHTVGKPTILISQSTDDLPSKIFKGGELLWEKMR